MRRLGGERIRHGRASNARRRASLFFGQQRGQRDPADVQAGACIIELTFLQGREQLDMPFTSLIQFDE